MKETFETPLVFIDENGVIVIIGFNAWNKAISYADADRAIPDSWTKLVPEKKDVNS